MEKSQDVRKDYGKIFQDAFLRMIHFNCFCNCISPVKGQVLGSKAKKNKTKPHHIFYRMQKQGGFVHLKFGRWTLSLVALFV